MDSSVARERRIERAAAVNGGLLPAGIFQTIHFGMMNDTALLDSLIVASPDDLPGMHDDRADRNPTFLKSFFRLFTSGFHEFVHGPHLNRLKYRA